MKRARTAMGSMLLALALIGCQQIETDVAEGTGGAVDSAPQPTSVQAPDLPRPKADPGGPPPGWFMAGMAPDDYRASLDAKMRHGGEHSARLANSIDAPSGFGTLMQSIEASHYRGSRVRLSGWVKSEDVRGWAGLWMRVDAGKESVAFDNMQRRPIKGSLEWHRVEVVLDVPRSADVIAFGVLLDDRGTVWIDDLNFEKVDLDVPTTDALAPTELPAGPQNLDFAG